MPKKSRETAAAAPTRAVVVAISLFLAALTWLVFGQTLRHGFLNYDDNAYVYGNPVIESGLTLHGIAWAFTRVHSGNWHPLTTISHMLDCQFYGLNAGGHHFSNVLLHSLAVILLFLVLWQMTGGLWRSAFVAAVFAIHPLRVESVAWISERKDLLSGVFFMLTLWFYSRYVRNPPSLARYLACASIFALGLMSKPMLVTVPFLLLLLDYWPLQRFEHIAAQRLFLEKIPLLALSLGSSVATVLAQRHTVSSIEQWPLSWRMSNAIVSCVAYLWQMIWPARLAVFYPLPRGGPPLWQAFLALVLLGGISAGVFLLRRKQPHLLVGWCWYLGMLVPVIGLVQVGGQARADRYTYLPQIGLYLMISWGLAALLAGWRYRRQILTVLVGVVLAALIWQSGVQTIYWRQSESLWRHTLAVTSDTEIAHNALGEDLLRQGRRDEAIEHFQTALRVRPGFLDAESNLGVTLLQEGKVDDAMIHLKRVLASNPQLAKGHFDMGSALLKKQEPNEAIGEFQKAVELQLDYAEAHNNLAIALFQTDRVDEAIDHWQRSLVVDPENAEAHNNLAVALIQKGRMREAIAHWQKALQFQPDRVGAQLFLAWVLATCPDPSLRDGTQALALAQHAQQLSGDRNPMVFRVLAAADAETGRLPEAVAAAEQGLRVATDAGNARLAELLQTEVDLYRSGAPFRDSGLTTQPSP